MYLNYYLNIVHRQKNESHLRRVNYFLSSIMASFWASETIEDEVIGRNVEVLDVVTEEVEEFSARVD